jgi:hypothetical protein
MKGNYQNVCLNQTGLHISLNMFISYSNIHKKKQQNITNKFKILVYDMN